ncbi:MULTISPECIES: nucleotidyltransferase family protein [Terrabacteria group]|uniref:nucleotidyltransferase family protein n=1 Tax=Bacillati TaxID=1783272 RepID=UPI00260BD4B2|nr:MULTISPECIES: nucleotidyltransferase family protein [Terrabacteria group]
MNLAIPIHESELKEFCQRYRVKRLSLFGSVLREDFNPQSDVDVLVEFEADAAVGFLTLSRMARELSEVFGRPVDLVPREGLKLAIRDAVLREEQVIYAT